jgi:hypothetical protein
MISAYLIYKRYKIHSFQEDFLFTYETVNDNKNKITRFLNFDSNHTLNLLTTGRNTNCNLTEISDFNSCSLPPVRDCTNFDGFKEFKFLNIINNDNNKIQNNTKEVKFKKKSRQNEILYEIQRNSTYQLNYINQLEKQCFRKEYLMHFCILVVFSSLLVIIQRLLIDFVSDANLIM